MNKYHYLIGVLLIPFTMVWRGFVLAKLWLWFVVPMFALPALSVPAALGVGCVTAFLTHQVPNSKPQPPKEEAEAFIRVIVAAFIFPAFALLTGIVVKAFL